jgi:2-amino-4-hydroxy-6-hydroxymethyldihydropteridine diphosphokinase
MQSQSLAAIALGSNMGDRHATLRRALTLLADSDSAVERTSPLLQTAPVASLGAPGPLGGPYINAAAIVRTSLAPRALLERLLQIERRLGRVRDPANRSGPRTIDLDLLLYADQVLDEPGLVVPHPRMHQRRFVLEPLAQVAPDWVVPTLGKTVQQLLTELPDEPPQHAKNQP